jgi:hypothetical protein
MEKKEYFAQSNQYTNPSKICYYPPKGYFAIRIIKQLFIRPAKTFEDTIF